MVQPCHKCGGSKWRFFESHLGDMMRCVACGTARVVTEQEKRDFNKIGPLFI